MKSPESPTSEIHLPDTHPLAGDDEFDYSTPEAEAALRAAGALILELREDLNGPLARKVALYERTLGLAVVPVLVRRVLLRAWSRNRGRLRAIR